MSSVSGMYWTQLASRWAVLLQPLQCCFAAKHKTTFTPHVDCGDFVIIVNADKAVLTGKKLTQKYYRHHTGWVGGLKEVQYKTLMAEKPEFAMQLAVKGMLPKNSIGRQSATRLKVFAGENHNHQAQKPENWEK